MRKAPISRGHAVIVQPDEGASFWQPLPANGYAEPKLTPDSTGFEGLSVGFQTIAPGCHVHAHSHSANAEFLTCFSGRGRILVDGEEHPFTPRTTCFLGSDVSHEIRNDGDEPLVLQWAIAPGGLERFFAAVGRPRRAGGKAPEPFERNPDAPHHYA